MNQNVCLTLMIMIAAVSRNCFENIFWVVHSRKTQDLIHVSQTATFVNKRNYHISVIVFTLFHGKCSLGAVLLLAVIKSSL